MAGRLEFKSSRITLTPAMIARQGRGVVRFGPSELALEDFEADLAGGRASGQLAFRRAPSGLALQARIGLAGAEAGSMPLTEGRPAVAGRLSLQLDADGAGLSPASLFGSLAGNGVVSLERAQLAALDPKAFDMAMRAADQGLTIDTQRVRRIVDAALDSGRLAVPQIDSALAINAGQVRLASTVAHGEGADLALSGSFDLSAWTLDARLTLSGSKLDALPGAGRPDVFIALKGPPTAPQRSTDVSALVGWLTLRAIEQQSKRLQALEETRRLEVIEEARKLRAQEEAKRLEAIEQARREEAIEAARRERPADATPPPASPPTATVSRPSGSEVARPARRPDGPPSGDEGATASVPGSRAPALPPPIDIRPMPIPAQPRAARPGTGRAESDATGQARPQFRGEERVPGR
jgi:large subunit ribosomal protein L24